MAGQLPEDPFKKNPFGDLLNTLNQFFQERPGKNLLGSIDEFFGSPNPFGGFPVELDENDQNYIVTAKLPGIKKSQIGIDVFQHYVTITVIDHEQFIEENESQQIIKRKQSMKKSSRTIPFSSPINEQKVKASHQDGILTLILPKIKGKRIEL